MLPIRTRRCPRFPAVRQLPRSPRQVRLHAVRGHHQVQGAVRLGGDHGEERRQSAVHRVPGQGSGRSRTAANSAQVTINARLLHDSVVLPAAGRRGDRQGQADARLRAGHRRRRSDRHPLLRHERQVALRVSRDVLSHQSPAAAYPLRAADAGRRRPAPGPTPTNKGCARAHAVARSRAER